MSDVQYIFNQLKHINQANGCLTNVTEVAEAEEAESVRPRGVAVCQENGSVMLRINAETKTLDMLKQYIGEMLDDQFVIETTDDAAALKATPKQQPQAAPAVAEEDDDATA